MSTSGSTGAAGAPENPPRRFPTSVYGVGGEPDADDAQQESALSFS